MDVYCANCGEPWDHYHMRNDEPWEWGLPEFTIREFVREGRFHGPNDPVFKAAEAAGWKFAGNTPFAILRCPCCKDGPERLGILRQKVIAAVAVLGNDEDGLVAALNDAGELNP